MAGGGRPRKGGRRNDRVQKRTIERGDDSLIIRHRGRLQILMTTSGWPQADLGSFLKPFAGNPRKRSKTGESGPGSWSMTGVSG